MHMSVSVCLCVCMYVRVYIMCLMVSMRLLLRQWDLFSAPLSPLVSGKPVSAQF